MSTAGQAAGAAQQAAGETASTAKQEASQTASTATAAAADVATTAKEQAGAVAGEAVNQARQLADQARGQVSEQASNATQKLSDSVRQLASEVRDLSQGRADGSGPVAGLAQQLADKGEQVAEFISRQGPGGLVQELRGFAARRPGTFLLGALAAGLATGRVVKGASAASSGAASPGYGGQQAATDLSVQPLPLAPTVATPVPAAEPHLAGEPYTTAEPYPTTTPVAMSDNSGILDDAADTPPPYEPGTGLR